MHGVPRVIFTLVWGSAAAKRFKNNGAACDYRNEYFVKSTVSLSVNHTYPDSVQLHTIFESIMEHDFAADANCKLEHRQLDKSLASKLPGPDSMALIVPDVRACSRLMINS